MVRTPAREPGNNEGLERAQQQETKAQYSCIFELRDFTADGYRRDFGDALPIRVSNEYVSRNVKRPCDSRSCLLVIPAKAGIHGSTGTNDTGQPGRGGMDPRFRGDDGNGRE